MTESESNVGEPELAVRKRLPLLGIATSLNAVILLILWVVEGVIAERLRFLVWLTYVPQQPFGIPLLILLPWSVLARRWRLFLANITVAAAFLLTFLGFNIPFGSAGHSASSPFRLMTLNTRVGINGVDKIVRLVESESPDILCLQETRGWRGNPDPLPPILRRLPGWNMARAGDVATVSRHPIEQVKSYPMLPLMDRAALQTTIRLPQGSVTIFNVHYNTNYRRRPEPNRSGLPRLSLRALARWEQTSVVLNAADPVAGPRIVAGDFNNPPRGLTYARLSERFTDSFRAAGWGFGYTFRSDLPLMRIDYIFTSPEIGVAGCRSLDSDASDHRAVVADLSVRSHIAE